MISFNPIKQLLNVVKGRAPKRTAQHIAYPKGKFIVEHVRNNQVINTYEFNNDITNEGANLLLNVMFNSATQIASSSWYIGLISSVSYSALAAGDTMASHAGWTEHIAYDESTRVAWGQATTTTRNVTNSSPAVFTMNATGTVKGLFLASNSSKSGTTGKLWATALFNADTNVVDDDVLRITYAVTN